MYFDFVKELVLPGTNKPFEERESLWQTSKSIEENIRTQPNEAVKQIRDAITKLVQGLLKEDGVTQFPKHVPLYQWIEEYRMRCPFIRNKQGNALQQIRSEINPSGHPDPQFTIEKALKYASRYSRALARIFELNIPEIKMVDLPIGPYQILKKIEAKDFESVCGKYNYFAVSDKNKAKTYAYIRLFQKNEDNTKVFEERDADMQAFFSNMRGSKYIIKASEIETGPVCDIRYLAYEVHENTQRLSDIDLKQLSDDDVLEIVSQLAEGLSDLSTKKIHIHHRGIRPEFIFIDKDDEGYFARLGCFETAKIQVINKYMQTVSKAMLAKQPGNLFIHPNLIGVEDASSEDWERGDVYSLSCLFLYCLDHNNFMQGTKKIDSDEWRDYSNELVTTMEMIFNDPQLQFVPRMREFRDILRRAQDG